MISVVDNANTFGISYMEYWKSLQKKLRYPCQTRPAVFGMTLSIRDYHFSHFSTRKLHVHSRKRRSAWIADTNEWVWIVNTSIWQGDGALRESTVGCIIICALDGVFTTKTYQIVFPILKVLYIQCFNIKKPKSLRVVKSIPWYILNVCILGIKVEVVFMGILMLSRSCDPRALLKFPDT